MIETYRCIEIIYQDPPRAPDLWRSIGAAERL